MAKSRMEASESLESYLSWYLLLYEVYMQKNITFANLLKS